MDNEKLGILIIIFFVIVSVASGGEIFKVPSSAVPANNTENRYPGSGSSSSSNDPQRNLDNVLNRVSPYKDKVFISYVNDPGSFNEYVTLRTDLDFGETVLITGWKLRSTITGSEFTIGGAADLPVDGYKIENPIILPDNARVVLKQQASPINSSFRVNKCTGYFEEDYNFTPSLDRYCPAVIDDAPPLSATIDDDCLDYIETLPRCQEPKERNFPEGLTRQCEDFLETKVNYLNCALNHRNDSDFYRKEWRVFGGRGKILWREERETIQLIDNSGLIVDTYSY